MFFRLISTHYLSETNNNNHHFTSGLVKSIIEAYLELQQIDQAKNIYIQFISNKESKKSIWKPFIRYYVESMFCCSFSCCFLQTSLTPSPSLSLSLSRSCLTWNK
jgi:hypothetical protein